VERRDTLKIDLTQAQLLIFDLDGTLYEDTNHFAYFASLLQAMLPPDRQAAFAADYDDMLAGHHPVAIGKAYDIQRDVILTPDPITLHATAVCDWDGNPWSRKRIEETYPGPLTFDFERIVAIGDGWWLPFAAAKHHGVRDTYAAYVKTKEYLATHKHLLTRIPGLRSWLEQQRKSKALVLVTNSEQDDVERLLTQLDLHGLFHQTVTNAKKPTHTAKVFQQLLQEYAAQADEAVSIGDNYLNEVAPALHLGMKAVLLQNTPVDFHHPNLLIVPSLRNLFSV
jgi:FMN phosphatase YigB (HAD superfamily)